VKVWWKIISFLDFDLFFVLCITLLDPEGFEMVLKCGICHCNQGFEDTSHFLFSCPFYANQRATIITGVGEILHKVSLNHLEIHRPTDPMFFPGSGYAKQTTF
jgi:predicted oxidoreductase